DQRGPGQRHARHRDEQARRGRAHGPAGLVSAHMATVGLLALQGGYKPHGEALARLGHSVVEVRTARELAAVDGLVLPGGESTTHLLLIARWDLEPALHALVRARKPVLAT